MRRFGTTKLDIQYRKKSPALVTRNSLMSPDFAGEVAVAPRISESAMALVFNEAVL